VVLPLHILAVRPSSGGNMYMEINIFPPSRMTEIRYVADNFNKIVNNY
jgi:hypothetical protein